MRGRTLTHLPYRSSINYAVAHLSMALDFRLLFVGQRSRFEQKLPVDGQFPDIMEDTMVYSFCTCSGYISKASQQAAEFSPR